MKRKYYLLVLFLVAVCLLSFIEVSYSNEEPKKYGEFWNSLSDIRKATFVLAMDYGIIKGFELCIIGCMGYYFPKSTQGYIGIQEEEERAAIAYLAAFNDYLDLRLSLDLEVIPKVITELYKDPANIYIRVEDMYIIALHEIKGEDVEPLLRKAREKVLQEFKKKWRIKFMI